MIMRLRAAESLLKRYAIAGLTWNKSKKESMNRECINVISDINTHRYQKKAARILLNFINGTKIANEMIDGIAIITERNDPLLFRWKRKVLERDKQCVKCGEKDNLQAHHISHWSDDPVNRINIENGIALCDICHSLEHPELSINLFVRS